MQTALLTATQLKKSFGNSIILNNVSLQVHTGEVVGFLGINGAGKSTTMRLLSGFLPPDSGTVHINGINLADNPVQSKKQMGYLPEGAPLYGDMRVIDFLTFMANIRGLHDSQAEQAISTTVQQTHLETVATQRIETLSKGFRRRVGLAQALLHQPSVLLLDEPTDGLDPNQKNHLRQTIREMATHKAILLSTHILEEVQATCTRVLLLHQGDIVAQGTPADLIAEHQSLEQLFVHVTKGAYQ